MNSFLRAAIAALKLERRPLTTHEIVHVAISQGFLKTEGLTPHKTMNARLSEHLLEGQHESLLMRVGPAKFGLREWSEKIPEYVAPRRKLNPIEEDILVFPVEQVREFAGKDGLNVGNISLLKEIIELSYPMQRLKAEERNDVVQLVSSFLITYKDCIETIYQSGSFESIRSSLSP